MNLIPSRPRCWRGPAGRVGFRSPLGGALGGADGITVHLREDRRHIQDRDVRILRETVGVKLNLELSVAPEIVAFACQVKPDQATLVPERREEVTTEGGLDVVRHEEATKRAVEQLRA